MGVLINKIDDLDLFRSAVNESLSIVKSAQEKSVIKKGRSIYPLCTTSIFIAIISSIVAILMPSTSIAGWI